MQVRTDTGERVFPRDGHEMVGCRIVSEGMGEAAATLEIEVPPGPKL